MLITRPNHDITTNYLYYWSEQIIDFASEKGVSVFDLAGKKATKNEFVGRMKKLNPKFVMFNGHGNPGAIGGYNNETLVDMKNIEILEGRIIFSRSCSSAQVLGASSVKNGGAFIGYNDDFVFLIDNAHVTKPLNDKLAALFLAPSNHVAVALLKQHSAGEATERSRAMFRQSIVKALSTDATDDDKDALPYLVWDMSHQVCLGDQTLKV